MKKIILTGVLALAGCSFCHPVENIKPIYGGPPTDIHRQKTQFATTKRTIDSGELVFFGNERFTNSLSPRETNHSGTICEGGTVIFILTENLSTGYSWLTVP